MTADELEEAFRLKVRDTAYPYQFSSDEFIAALDDAVRESCERKQLIFDKTTAAVCQISFAIGDQVKDLHVKITDVLIAYLVDAAGTYYMLDDIDKVDLQSKDPAWRENTSVPTRYIVGETTIELDAPADVAYTMHLEVYRRPLESVAGGGTPEIAEAHHKHLLQWCYREYYDVRDADTYAPALVDKHEQAFTDYFGERPRAKSRRKSWASRPQHNKVW